MRRADRLFRIVEHLKARKGVVKARELANELDVSLRTIYRDVADLMAAGTPIHGEAGVGYALDRHHMVRPLMFTAEELDALTLGAQMVRSWGDDKMASASSASLDKIRSVVPADVGRSVEEEILFSFPSRHKLAARIDLSLLRVAIRSKQIVEFGYRSEQGAVSARRVRPLCLAFFAPVWLLLGWCEARRDFRNFRLDRMSKVVVRDERFRDERGRRLRDYLATVAGVSARR